METTNLHFVTQIRLTQTNYNKAIVLQIKTNNFYSIFDTEGFKTKKLESFKKS